MIIVSYEVHLKFNTHTQWASWIILKFLYELAIISLKNYAKIKVNFEWINKLFELYHMNKYVAAIQCLIWLLKMALKIIE